MVFMHRLCQQFPLMNVVRRNVQATNVVHQLATRSFSRCVPTYARTTHNSTSTTATSAIFQSTHGGGILQTNLLGNEIVRRGKKKKQNVNRILPTEIDLTAGGDVYDLFEVDRKLQDKIAFLEETYDKLLLFGSKFEQEQELHGHVDRTIKDIFEFRRGERRSVELQQGRQSARTPKTKGGKGKGQVYHYGLNNEEEVVLVQDQINLICESYLTKAKEIYLLKLEDVPPE